MSKPPPGDETPRSYAEGLAELEGILDYLQGSDVDLESVADQVERAGQLIRFCRQRLDNVTVQVRDVLKSIETVLEEEE